MAATVKSEQRVELAMDFSKLDCDRLKIYLRERGISATGYNKKSLVRLATCASEISVEIDPDKIEVDIAGQVRKNLEQLGFHVPDPFELGFSDDFQ